MDYKFKSEKRSWKSEGYKQVDLNSSPMILLIGNYLSDPHHNQNAWQDLAAHLRSAGYSVVTTSHVQNKVFRLLDMLCTIYTQRNHYQLAQIDVFSGPAFTWAYLSGRLLKSLNKCFILTLHGGNLPQFAKKHERQVRWLLSQASAVTAPSRYLQQKMRDYRSNLLMIPNALDIQRYKHMERSQPQPKLVWLRGFHEIYHPQLAVEVLAILKEQFPQISLTMVGPDKGDGSLEKTSAWANELKVNELISIPGGVQKTNVPDWLNKGDIFLNTTNIDNTPISVMEAMACGLCIVSTNVGGLPYLLEDGVDALLVPPNDPEAMAAAVRRILTEPGLAERLSTNARRKAEQFDWSIILPQWERLFESIK